MKLKSKILSAILALTVVASSILPVTMVANAAGRSSPGGGGSSAYTPGKFTYVYLNSDIVMRIGISSITDESNGSDIKSEVGRYGNGIRTIMHEYPLFIRAEHYDAGEGAGKYLGVPYKAYNDNIDTIYSDIKSLKDQINGGRAWRTSRYKEFWEGNVISYTANSSISGEGGSSVYLEDAVLKVKDLYDNGKISGVELRDFWYFYTRMALVAMYNKKGDIKDGNTSFTTGMSDKLNELFTGYTGAGKGKTYNYAILDKDDRKATMQSGFLIALYAVYGNIPFKEVTGNNFTKSNSHHLFSNDYTSFVFDKCWTDDLQNYSEPYLLVSTHTWAELRAYHDSMSANTYEEKRFYPNSGIGWDVIPKLAPNMCPAYTNNVYDADGKIIHKRFEPRYPPNNETNTGCAGWSYYEIATGGDSVIKVGYPNSKNAQLEVTYNAFLTSGDSDSDYTNESDTFGDNGHVMTDTVYLSDVMSESEVIKSINPRANSFVDGEKYFNTTVENQIYLSAPFEKTEYKLKNLQYRIVDAGGSLDDVNGKTITYGSDRSTNNNISVSGSKFKSAFNNEIAKYYVIQRKKITDNGVVAGQYKDDSGALQYYKVYLSSADGKSMTDNSMNLKDANKYIDKNSSNNGKNKWGYIKWYTGVQYPPSTYCLKIEGEYYPIIKENNTYYLCPRQFVNNLLVQVRADYTATYNTASVLNNNNGTERSAKYDEFLLTKNYSTADMISDKENKLYSMIDDYSTNAWGNTFNRYNNYYDSTNTKVSIKDNYKANEGTFVYDIGSLFGSRYLLGGESWFAHASDLTMYKYYVKDAAGRLNRVTESGISAAIKGIREWHSIYSSELLTNSKVKTQFRTEINRTSPLLSLNTGDGKTYLNSSLPVLVKSYDNSMNINSSIRQSGLYYTSADYAATDKKNKDVSYVATNPKAYLFSTVTTNTRDDDVRKYDATINYWSNYYGEKAVDAVGDYNKYDVTNGGNLYHKAIQKTLVPLYGAEIPVGKVTGFNGSVDLTKDKDNGFSRIRDIYRVGKYMQVDFEKLLTYYNKYLYQKRGSINASLTPSIASWVYSNSTANTYATEYAMSYGTKNSSTYVGYEADKAEYTKNDGFIRFGSVRTPYGGYRNLLNSQGVPTALQRISLSAHVDNTEFKGGALDVFATTGAIAPQTQSSYDVPIRYTILSHNTETKYGQVKKQTYKKNPNNKSVSLSWQHGTNGTTSTTGTFIKIYPEVIMWAEKDKTSNPSSETKYTPVTTVGAKPRYIPAMTYSTVTFNDLKSGVNVIGTAVAYDTRAKKLAQTLGTVDTQVLYSGTAINGTASANAGGSVQTYVFDFRAGGSLNGQNIKNAWGNDSYDSKNVASVAMGKLLGNFEVSQSSSLAIYNGKDNAEGYKEIPIGSSVERGALTTNTPALDPIVYNIFLSGGKVNKVDVRARTGELICTYGILDNDWSWGKSTKEATRDSISSTSLTEKEKTTVKTFISSDKSVIKSVVNDILANMQVSDIANNVFEHDTGVTLPTALKNSTGGTKSYNEDCSVLQIRSYTAPIVAATSKATFAEQIPINVGPQTPVNKNNYFSNGYKGFVNATAEITVKTTIPGVYNAGDVVTFAKSMHKKKGSTDTVIVNDYSTAKACIPDFIIGDVPISEAVNG